MTYIRPDFVKPTATTSLDVRQESSRPNADDLLSREIGVRQLAATIFNYTVGSGIFVIPAFAAARLGSAAILAYLVCSVIMGLMVVCFAEAGSRVSTTGGAYAYIDAALGPFVGFLGGVLLLFVDLTAAAAVATIFSQSLLALLDAPSSRVLVMATAGVTLAVVSAINIAGIKRGVLLVEILVAAKLIPLAVFLFAGGTAVHTENLHWTTTPTFSSVAATSGFLIFAFLGIEGALTPSGEVRAPARTVPRAAFLAIAAVTALYIAVQLVAQGLLGPALADDRVAPLASALAVAMGPIGRTLILAGATISMFGFLSSSLMAGPRLLFALGRDGFGPRALAAVHPGFRTPYVAIICYAAISLALSFSGTFEQLAILGNLSGLLLYMSCAVAAWVLRQRDVRSGGEPFRAPGGPLVPILACAAMGWVLIETISRTEVIAVSATLATGSLVYIMRARKLPK
jgi:amino acid transporter